jgi:DNA-binding transcriptional ArsR family regulator
MEEKAAIRSLLALAHGVRLRAFRALIAAGPEGMTPGALTQALEVPATSLSFHLKELANAGLVTQERQGRNLIYRAAFDQMNGLMAYLTENCCGGAPCADVCGPSTCAC